MGYLIVLIIGFIIGVVIDNLYAPKATFENGKLTFTWHNTKIK